MMMALTSVVTTAPSEAPMMTPIASAKAFDLVRNALKPPIPVVLSVLDDLGHALRLGDPAGDLVLRRHPADHVRACRIHFLEGRGEVRRVALGKLGGRIDPGGLEQVGILRADALDAHQVDAVDP